MKIIVFWMIAMYSSFQQIKSIQINPIEDRVYAMMQDSNSPSYICCTASGPSTSISWTRRPPEEMPGGKYTIRYLKLNHLSKENTQCLELYSRRPIQETLFCNARNLAGAVHKPVVIRFVSKDSDPSLYNLLPSFDRSLSGDRRGIAVDIGSEVEISWRASSTALPLSVKWFVKKARNGENLFDEVRETHRIRLIESSDIYSLKIYNVELEDDGSYVSEIRNEYGWAVSPPIRIAIRGYKSTATIIEPKTDLLIYVNHGEVRSLRCVAVGVPAPETAWYKEGKRIPSSEVNQIGSSVLTVRILESCEYECVSRNVQSSDRRMVRFEIRESRPIVSVEEITSRSVRLRIECDWRPSFFDVKLDDGKSLVELRLNPDEDEINNLEAATEYTVSVSVIGSKGLPIVSDNVKFRTEDEQCLITDLRVVQIGEDFVELDWSKCSVNHTDYAILFARERPGLSAAHWNKVNYEAGRRSIITDLENNASYIFYVVPLDLPGTGKASNSAVATTLPHRSIKVTIADEDGIRLNWSSPPVALSHYILKYAMLDSSGDSMQREHFVKNNSYRLPASAYNAQVIGYNGDMMISSSKLVLGESSKLVEFPPILSDLILQSQSPSSINASWKYADSRPITFKVSWFPYPCPIEGMAICSTYEHNVSHPNYIIQDLAPDIQYTVSVAAVDGSVSSVPINASVKTLPKYPPSPAIQSVRRYNSTNARIRMSRVRDYPKVRDYVIRYVDRIVVDQWASPSIRKSISEKWKNVIVQDRQQRFVDIDIGRLDVRSIYTLAVSTRAERTGELIEGYPSPFYLVDVQQETIPEKIYSSKVPSPSNLTTVAGTIRSNSAQLAFKYRNRRDSLNANYIEIIYEGYQSYIDSLGFSQRFRDIGINNITLKPHRFTTSEDLYLWILSALLPNTLYTVNVSAVHMGKSRETSYPASVVLHTKYDVPPYIEIPYFVAADKESRTVSINLKKASSKNGPISLYFIVLERFDLAEPYGISSAYSFRESIDPHQKTVAVFNSTTDLPSMFKLGNNASSQEYHKKKMYKYLNEPLEPGGKYRVKLCVQVKAFGDGGDLEPLLIDCSSYSSVFSLASSPRRRTSSAQKFSTTVSFNYSLVWLSAIVLLIIVILSIFVILVFQIRRVNSRSGDNCDEGKQGLLDSKIESLHKASFAPSINDYQSVPMLKHQNTSIVMDESSNGTCISVLKRNSEVPIEQSPISTGNPILMTEFITILENLKQNDHFALSQEYDSIDPGQHFTWKYSLLDSNRSKNRYANITAYDHSRVVLSSSISEDYINANYIDGFLKPRTYVATQGPLPSTINDFWRLVWQEKTPAIIMLTKLEERQRKKCDRYWPLRKGQSETYGDITVFLEEVHSFASYILRNMRISVDGNDHSVLHFQFTGWPDHGVPVQSTSFLMFCERVRQLTGEIAQSPLIVHCSAGVGRTGCFVVVHNLMLKLDCDLNAHVLPVYIDICAYVTQIRGQRNYMVQTDEQYLFIYDCMAELVRYGGRMNHCVLSKDLSSYVQSLLSSYGSCENEGGSISRMEIEFKRLASGKASSDKFFTATLEINRFKNRLVNILPFEWNRFVLDPPSVSVNGLTGLPESSDYINASRIDSYEHRGAYIAAQGPLSNTVTEFWMMIWQSDCSIVVMLTKLMEMGKERCAQYWPQQGFSEYSHLRIDSIAHYNMRNYTVSEFKLTHIPEGKTRTIRQFRYLKWPDQGVPEDASGFLDLVNQVQKTKEQFGLDNGPIIVHCSSGVSQTGIFITISLCIERLRLDNCVDVFMTVRLLRSQRIAMVQTEDQYQFCYRAILQYIGCILEDT